MLKTGDKSNEATPATVERLPEGQEKIVEKVRERYAAIVEQDDPCCAPAVGPCCGSAEGEVARKIGYDSEELERIPDGANLGLGCGAPVARLELQPGEVMLDLGSGAGMDAFVAAPLVGESGRVIGVDMTPEMLTRARENASKAGLDHVEFREGRLEELPVEDASIDAVTSNCVINLVPDKARVFGEIARVLRSGGRLVVSDIVLDGELPAELTRDLTAYVGCVAGAMRREKYFGMLESAGLGSVEILQDVDYLAAIEDALPDELRALAERTGVKPEELRGTVRSVTYRAIKP